MKAVPKYRRQKQHGKPDRSFVELNNRRIYLGNHGAAESKARYKRLIAEWLAGGCLPVTTPDEITIAELVARYWRHAKRVYRKPDGTPTSEQSCLQAALRPLLELYEDTRASDCGLKRLKTVREQMIKAGNCRTTANRYVGRIRMMFKWAVAEELIEPRVFQGLQCLAAGLGTRRLPSARMMRLRVESGLPRSP